MDDNVVRARVEAYGRVQGVFYRDTVRRAAIGFGVAGSAINRSDGAVEMVFEGSRSAVDKTIEVAREGSRGAAVERLEIEWQSTEGLTGFTTG